MLCAIYPTLGLIHSQAMIGGAKQRDFDDLIMTLFDINFSPALEGSGNIYNLKACLKRTLSVHARIFTTSWNIQPFNMLFVLCTQIPILVKYRGIRKSSVHAHRVQCACSQGPVCMLTRSSVHAHKVQCAYSLIESSVHAHRDQ